MQNLIKTSCKEKQSILRETSTIQVSFTIYPAGNIGDIFTYRKLDPEKII
jgi:hypothetical protein